MSLRIATIRRPSFWGGRNLLCAAVLMAFALLFAQETRAGFEEPLGIHDESLLVAARPTLREGGARTAPSSSQSGGGAAPAAASAAASPAASSGASASSGKAAPAASSGAPIRLFGTVEFRSPLKGLPKWDRVRNAERKSPSFSGGGISTNNAQVSKRWSTARGKLQGGSLMEKVKGVNAFFNQWPYKTDIVLYGVEDYWATPREFVQKSGDCEDYAIAKYYALRDLGVPGDIMRVAAVKDTIRNLGHAVLVVFMQNDAYVLDNLTNMVLSHKKLPHYAPQFSVNEQFLWRHVKPKAAPGR